MTDYIVSGSDLTSIADAIRTKGGTSASLAFPAGFVSAIGDIPAGSNDGESGTYIGAGSGNMKRTVPVTKQYTHFFICAAKSFSELSTQNNIDLYMAYATTEGYTIVPLKNSAGGYTTNAVNNRLATSYDNWRSQVTFGSTSIEWAFIGNGAIVTPITGEAYYWRAW